METVAEREARLFPVNDALWGPGNWIECHQCPLDADGRAPYHHRDAHAR
jgi:hypothetical protein